MRTTLNIDDNLLRKARERARATNRTLTRIIEESLRQALTGTPPGPSPAHTFTLKTVRGTLLPGVDRYQVRPSMRS